MGFQVMGRTGAASKPTKVSSGLSAHGYKPQAHFVPAQHRLSTLDCVSRLHCVSTDTGRIRHGGYSCEFQTAAIYDLCRNLTTADTSTIATVDNVGR
jgi:hypothetical protein